MLTTGSLGRSLSPDPLDIDDERPILNLDKVVEQRLVFYVCLDSLPDKAVASALGSILLADLAALSGIRYNLHIATPRVSLFVDEVSDVINEPLIEIVNKAAESGVTRPARRRRSRTSQHAWEARLRRAWCSATSTT